MHVHPRLTKAKLRWYAICNREWAQDAHQLAALIFFVNSFTSSSWWQLNITLIAGGGYTHLHPIIIKISYVPPYKNIIEKDTLLDRKPLRYITGQDNALWEIYVPYIYLYIFAWCNGYVVRFNSPSKLLQVIMFNRLYIEIQATYKETKYIEMLLSNSHASGYKRKALMNAGEFSFAKFVTWAQTCIA